MNLHSPAFERALKQAAWRTIRESPDLLREYRRAGREWTWERVLGRILLVVFLPIVFAFAVGLTWVLSNGAAGLTRDKYSALAVTSYFSALWVVQVGAMFSLALKKAPDLQLFWGLPIPAELICRRKLDTLWRESTLAFPFMLASITFVTAAFPHKNADWLGISITAVVIWVITSSAVIATEAWWPTFPRGTLIGLMFILFGIVTFWRSDLRLTQSQLVALGSALNVVLPTGWPMFLLLYGGAWAPLILLIPIGAAVSASRARLLRTYVYDETLFPQHLGMNPLSQSVLLQHQTLQLQQVLPNESEAPAATALAEEYILSREFLKPSPWEEFGVMERWLWRWLTERERVALEFAFPRGQVLGKLWKVIFAMTLVGAVIAFAGPRLFGPYGMFGLIALAVPALATVGVALNVGYAPNKAVSGGVTIPHLSLLPIGYRELGMALLKQSVVQLPSLVVTLAGVGAAEQLALNESPLIGAIFGATFSILFVGARPAFVTLLVCASFSVTGFFRRVFWAACLTVACFALFGMNLAVFIPTSRHDPFHAHANAFVIIAPLASYALFRIVGRLHGRWRFDLIQAVRTQTQILGLRVG